MIPSFLSCAFSASRNAVATGLCALVALAIIPSGAVSAQTAMERISQSGTIRIAVPTDFPPYGFVGTDLAPQGLDIDMGRLIATAMGAKLELVPVTSANRIPYLQTGKADLVISTLGKNPEREKVIDFTAAYAPFFQAIYGPKNVEIKTFADLVGKTIAVTRGAIEDQELSRVALSGTDIKRFEDNAVTVSAFVSGQTQLIATGASVADVMIKRNPQLSAEYKLLLKDSPNFVGVAKGEDALRKRVNEIIAKARAGGEIDALSQKWLGRPAGDLPK